MTGNLPTQPAPAAEPKVDEMLQDIDGVVVDRDGTVVDNAEMRLSALQQALALYDVDVDPQWYALNSGLPILEIIARLAGPRTLPVEEIVPASRRLLLSGPPPQLIDSTMDLLHRAEALGLPRAVASAAAGVLIHPVIDRLDLSGLLPVVVTAESVARGKPAPDAYLETARLIGRAPSRCLAVDDAPDGIASAPEAGMRVLAVRDGLLVPVSGLVLPCPWSAMPHSHALAEQQPWWIANYFGRGPHQRYGHRRLLHPPHGPSAPPGDPRPVLRLWPPHARTHPARLPPRDRGGPVAGHARPRASSVGTDGRRPHFVRADVRVLPFHSASADAVLMLRSFGFLDSAEEDLAVLKEAARIARPGALLGMDHFLPTAPRPRWAPGS